MSLERHITLQRARKENIFSARGSLLCRENLMVLGLAALTAMLWAAGAAFSAAGENAKASLPLPDGQLVVCMLDVHQGDAIFIQTPDMRRILLDAGPAPIDTDSFSAGKDKIVPWLREHGIDRLDAFIMSHAHADHIGGLAALLQSIPIDRFYDPGFDFSSDIYEQNLQIIESSNESLEHKIDYQIVHQGETLPLGDQVLMQILGPVRPYISGSRSDCNSNSTVLRLAYKNVTFLFMGDSEEETEKRLVDYGRGLRSTFLKVAHHGSRYSSSAPFLNLVHPRVALISCGKNNAFGHPHEEALDRIRATGAQIHRTDEEGDVFVITDGSRYKIISSRS